MKKFFSFLLLGSLLLTACGDDSGTGETTDSSEVFYFTYKTADFEMEVPDDWEVIDSFTSEYPDELRVAFKNDVQDSVFTANVSILREENTESDTSYDYAQRKLADHEETLLDYKLLSQEVINLEVGGAESKTMLTTFEGKNNTSAPLLNFMQVTLTTGEEAWVATATYREGEDAITLEKMDTMLRSFTLR